MQTLQVALFLEITTAFDGFVDIIGHVRVYFHLKFVQGRLFRRPLGFEASQDAIQSLIDLFVGDFPDRFNAFYLWILRPVGLQQFRHLLLRERQVAEQFGQMLVGGNGQNGFLKFRAGEGHQIRVNGVHSGEFPFGLQPQGLNLAQFFRLQGLA